MSGTIAREGGGSALGAIDPALGGDFLRGVPGDRGTGASRLGIDMFATLRASEKLFTIGGLRHGSEAPPSAN